MRRAFTLIELMISIVILSILMLFLYKSYSSPNRSNMEYLKEVQKIQKIQKIKKTLYLDLALARLGSMQILNQSKEEDILFLQSTHSLHNRVEPYIAYIVKNKKLYRLESLKKFKGYPLSADSEFDADFIGELQHFRIYQNDTKAKVLKYLVDCDFKNMPDILLKIKPLNGR